MDAIGTEREDVRVPVRRRPAAGRGVPLAAGLALTAALIGFLAGRLETTGGPQGSGAVSGLTGSVVLRMGPNSCEPQELALSDQTECRGEDWRGTIAFHASGDRTGTASLRSSASYVFTDFGPVVAHMWGTAAVKLDGRSCAATFGLSSYTDSGEGGGSLHLRCDDESVLGAAITIGDGSLADDGSPAPLVLALTAATCSSVDGPVMSEPVAFRHLPRPSVQPSARPQRWSRG
jgi:hypothetical protein